MPKGIIGESGADRATDRMDRLINRSKESIPRMPTLLEQFKLAYPKTWKEEIKKAKAEYEKGKKNS